MSRNSWVCVCALVAVTALSGCATLTGAGGLSGEQLIVSRCTVCHTRQRIDVASHDRAGWEATVGRMRSRGARLSDQEAQIVIDYLSARAD